MSDHVTEQLDDFVDGRLDSGARANVEQHVESCADCRTAEQQLRALLRSAHELPRTIEPPPAVWARIRARTIDERAQRRTLLWSLRYPLAAAAVVLMLLSSGLTALLLLRQPELVATPRSGPVALAAADVEYNRTVRQLELALERQSPELDTATVRVVRENLRIIDQAIAEARAALERNPDNPGLSRLVSNSYQRKIKMLERTIRLSASS
jgi:anti-sigma-K factor RskA